MEAIKNTLIICVLIFISHFRSIAQYDAILDSLVKIEIRRIYTTEKRPPKPNELDPFIQSYNRKKDSTFLSDLQFKISDAPKEEILKDIYRWQEVYTTTNKKIDTTWHDVMQHFYGLDRYLTYQFCIKNLMVWKPLPEELGAQEEPPAFNLASFPHAKFLYDHYALTEFLRAITGERQVPEDANYYFVYRFFYYLKEKTCGRDPACLEDIHRYVKSYYEVEKNEKANSVFIEAFENGRAFRSKSALRKFINQDKKKNEKN